MSEESEEKAKAGKMSPEIEEVRQHFKAAREAMHKSWAAIIPPGFSENRKTARKELLLGLRKLLDVAIEHTEKK